MRTIASGRMLRAAVIALPLAFLKPTQDMNEIPVRPGFWSALLREMGP